MRPMRRMRHAVGACLLCAVLAPGAGAAEKAAAKADAASQPADYPKMSLSNGVVKLTGRTTSPGRFVAALVTGSSTHDLVARVL